MSVTKKLKRAALEMKINAGGTQLRRARPARRPPRPREDRDCSYDDIRHMK